MKELKLALTLLALVVLSACSIASGSLGNSENGEYNFKLGHVYDENHAVQKGALYFAEQVYEKTDGKVTIDIYPNSQLGGDPALGEAIIRGSIDMAIFNQNTITGIEPRADIGSLPFLINSYEAADALYYDDGFIAEKTDEYLLDKGIRALSYFENDFRSLTNNQHPIESVEDLQGLTMRIPAIELLTEYFKALGAVPTVTDLSEMYTALQQGTVDGQDNGVLVTYSTRVYEVQDYMTRLNHMYVTSVLNISDKVWNELPEDIQVSIKEAAEEASKYQREANRANVETQLKEMEEHGVEVIELSNEEFERFREVGQSLWNDFGSVIGDDVLEELLEAADEANQLGLD